MKNLITIFFATTLLMSCRKQLNTESCRTNNHSANCGHCPCGIFCSGCFLNSGLSIVRPSFSEDIDHEPLLFDSIELDPSGDIIVHFPTTKK
jgi:hypothetical protein